MMHRMRERKHGFTIIELLIVIAIIAILAAVAIPALLKAQQSGKESAALQVLKSLRNAQETYRTRSTAVPKTYATLAQLKAAGSSPLTDAGLDATSGYTFACTLDATDVEKYTIVATAPKVGMMNYTMTETGEVTQAEKQ